MTHWLPTTTKGVLCMALVLILVGSIPAAAISGYLARSQARSDFESRRIDLIRGCERTNAVREVLFRNTTAAIDAGSKLDRTQIAAAFRSNLALLTLGPFVDPTTGLTNCDEAFQ